MTASLLDSDFVFDIVLLIKTNATKRAGNKLVVVIFVFFLDFVFVHVCLIVCISAIDRRFSGFFD